VITVVTSLSDFQHVWARSQVPPLNLVATALSTENLLPHNGFRL
jgi:hypothetical protein